MSLSKTLKEYGLKEDDWMWCLHCERFFQALNLRKDILGDYEACPFDDCDGVGIGSDIWIWNKWAEGNDKWPKSTGELHHGMTCRLYE